MSGTYKLNEKTLVMTITKMPKLAEFGLSTTAHRTVTGAIKQLGSKVLVMDTYADTGTQRSSKCEKL